MLLDKCCLCLINQKDKLKNIFSDQFTEVPLNLIINTLFHFDEEKLRSIAGDSEVICEICFKLVTEFYTFYTKVHETHNIFRHIEVKTEITHEITQEPQEISNANSPRTINDEDPLIICQNIDSTTEGFINPCTEDTYSQDDYCNRSEDSNSSENTAEPTPKKAREKYKEIEDRIQRYYTIECEFCMDNFETFYELQRHFQKIHKMRKGYIRCCKTKLTSYADLREHLDWHQNENIFTCVVCNKIFSRKITLEHHIADRHTDDNAKHYSCPYCERKFSRSPHMQQHIKTVHHAIDKSFECDICNRGFFSDKGVKIHKNSVHVVAELVCDICGRMFKTKSGYRNHNERNHSQSKKCEICGLMIKNEFGVKKHMKRYHDDSNVPVACPTCGKLCNNRESLKEHIKYVHVIKPQFKCSYCAKTFKAGFRLREHEATHTGVDIYSCPYCPRTFKTGGNVSKHKKIKHKEKYEIELSQKRYVSQKIKL